VGTVTASHGVPVTVDGMPFQASHASLDLAEEPGRLVLDSVNLFHLLGSEVVWTVDMAGVIFGGRGIVHDINARVDAPLGSVVLIHGPVERRSS
jgi:hypothetical protein